MLNINEIFNNKVYVYCPEHRTIHYCYHFGYVFNSKKIVFIKNLINIKNNESAIFVDQTFFKKLLKIDLNSNTKLFTILWNGDFDYIFYREELNKIKNKYNNFKIITQNNFNQTNKSYIPLNKLKLSRNNFLKKVSGISFAKKIKYFYPSIYSIYNFLRYFSTSKKLIFSKKIVFVGKADYADTIDCIKALSRSSNNYTKKFCKIFFDDLNTIEFLKNFSFKKILGDSNFQKLDFHEKYYLSNVLIRYLFISYLTKFKFFYHKNNTKFPLDLLNSNIYKNLTQLELGSKVGNSEIYSRRIMINKFYSNSFLKINFFKNDINYNEDYLFEERLLIIDKFLNELYSVDDYNMSQVNLKKTLINLNIKFLNHLN